MSEHPIVHIEFPAQNSLEAAKFYGDVFGWKITRDEKLNYSMFEYEEGRGGGFSNVSDENPVGNVLVYIQTDNIEASLAKIESHGGKTIEPKTEIPGVGWFAFFEDPTGNTIALYKGM